MIGFASSKHLSPWSPVWRCCLQQMIRAPNCFIKVQQRLNSQGPSSSLLSRLPPTSRLLTLRTASWPASRLCHNQHNTSKEGDKKHTQEGFRMSALVQAPKPALYLGFSGLIPFLSAPLLMAVTQSFYPDVAFAQVVYGASIVSFLGGARWGFALPEGSPAKPDWMNLGNSVVPSLLAWLALLCRDNVAEGAFVVIMGLGLSLHYDLTLLPGYPAWFKAMRTVLTLVATFSLVATLALKKFCPEKQIKVLQK